MVAMISPKSVVLAQVTDRLSPECVTVWLIEEDLSMEAFGRCATACAVGDVVYCRISFDGRYVDRIWKAGPKTHAAYADKIFDLA